MASNRSRKYVRSGLIDELWTGLPGYIFPSCLFCETQQSLERHHFPLSHSAGGDEFVYACSACHKLLTGGDAYWLWENLIADSEVNQQRMKELAIDIMGGKNIAKDPYTRASSSWGIRDGQTLASRRDEILDLMRAHWDAWTFAERLCVGMEIQSVCGSIGDGKVLCQEMEKAA